ncbi:MAG: FAD:protein FMN transferase [Magnetospirillum sp.]|nr:FAD:protein FMN transferase [Magnetospirillum sp.]
MAPPPAPPWPIASPSLERLEAVFSLYRPDSALCRLNAAGALDAPPLDLVRVLGDAAILSAASDGAFDVTVQPLWRLYAQTLAATGRPPATPEIEAARHLVDWRGIEVSPARIALARPGMAVTLNGLAQGTISDRVSEMLRRHGFAHALVDLGEISAPGPHADLRPWQVAVRDPADHTRTLRRLSLTGGGMATSEALGSSFAPGGAFGHVLDPASGRPRLEVASVTVRAASATLADGLSTALAVAGPARAGGILARFPGATAVLQSADGAVLEF